MEVLLGVVQWGHVLAGMMWAGGATFFHLVVDPATGHLPAPQRQALGQHLGRRAGRFFAVAGSATILLGIVRGTVLGPIQSWSALGSGYGRTWLVALILAAGLAMWGARIVGPAAEHLYGDERLWMPGEDGTLSATLNAQQQHLAVLTRVQLAGFAAIVACMVIMAEGLGG